MKFRSAPGVCLCILISCVPVFSWGDEGHKIIARIAYRQLKNSSKDADKKAFAKIDMLFPGGEAEFAEGATWADNVKKTTMTFTSSWHFLDTEIDAVNPSFTTTQIDHNCPKTGCAVSELISLISNLKKGNATAQKDTVRFVVHILGDIHQPLHVGERKDVGGNNIMGLTPGQTVLPNWNANTDDADKWRGSHNLHHDWDDVLVERGNGNDAVYATALMKRIKDENWAAKVGAAEMPEKWARESWENSRDFVYPKLKATTDKRVFQLDGPYLTGGSKIVADRMIQAGLRLANVLSQAYGQ